MNKKSVVFTIFLLIFIFAIISTSIQATTVALQRSQENAGDQTITIDNQTDKPVIISFLVSAQPTVGHFGILVPANTRKTKKIRESYWFAKQALGGFRQAGQPSQVRIIDVLNHGLADTIQVMVPNDQLRIFYIQPDSSFIITIAPEDM